jgi:hypothetical protein
MSREDAFAEDGLTHSPNGPFSPESLLYPSYAKALDDLFAFCASRPLSRSLVNGVAGGHGVAKGIALFYRLGNNLGRHSAHFRGLRNNDSCLGSCFEFLQMGLCQIRSFQLRIEFSQEKMNLGIAGVDLWQSQG